MRQTSGQLGWNRDKRDMRRIERSLETRLLYKVQYDGKVVARRGKYEISL